MRCKIDYLIPFVSGETQLVSETTKESSGRASVPTTGISTAQVEKLLSMKKNKNTY